MKTFKKVLCVILSVIMAMSSLSAVAFAADDSSAKFTDSFRYYTDKKDAYGMDKILDIVDVLLADVGFKEEVDLKVTKITIDLTSVNGLCDTLDLIKSVWGLVDSEDIVGDIADLNFDVWKSGMSRGSQDATILKELLEFLGTSTKKSTLLGTVDKTNAQVIAGLLDGDASLGLLDNFFDINDLLGADGLSGIIKDLILGDDYEAYKNDVDTWIYGKINDLAKEYLPGFTIDGSSTINGLLCLLFSVVINQYAVPALKGINVDLAGEENEVLQKLSGKINLKGDTYNFGTINFDPAKSLLDQINNEVGKIFSQVVPGYAWQSGGYTMISTNIESAFKYLGKETGIIPNADKMDLEGIVKEVIGIILNNVDTGAFGVGITECNTIEDMIKVLLVNVANELKIGTSYTNKDTYLVVLGDIVAFYACSIIDLEDADGNDYRAGGGKDVFEVVNYIANYFLLDKGVAKLLGMTTKKTETLFTKIDKLADYFGATKSKGIAFDSKKFILGNGTTKGLLDSVFTLDIQNIIEITAVPALKTAGDVPLEKFLYNTVRYCVNNWAGSTKAIPAYTTKAFTNALSNKSIGNLLVALLSALNNRSASIVTLLSTVASVISSYKVTSAIYGILDYVANNSQADLDKVKEQFGDLAVVVDWLKGFIEDNKDTIVSIKPYIDVIAETKPNEYAVTEVKVSDFTATGNTAAPKATVKLGTKTLTQGVDYVVVSDNSGIGAATATVKGIGLYAGSFEVPFNIVLGTVDKVKVANTASTVKLSWNKVPLAVKYDVYALEDGKYVLKQSSDATTYLAEKLAAGTEYTFKIVCEDASGTKTEKLFTTKTAPKAVAAKTIKLTATDTTVTVSWTKVAGATGYRVEQLIDGKWKKVATATGTSAKVSKLTPYTKYQFRVVSWLKDKNGNIISGEASAAKTVTTKVSVISGLKAATTSNTVTLSWKKATNVSGYQVQQYKGGKWVTIATIKKAATVTQKVQKLTANTKYQFRVRAYNGKVYGEWSTLTVYTNLVKTKNLKATKSTTTSVTLKWDKVAGAQGYEVYQYKSGKWTKVKTVTGTSVTVSGLKAGTTYKFYVRAYKKVSGKTVYGENSANLSAKTALGQVKNLKASARKKDNITLKWDKVTGATGYYIERHNGKKWVKIATVKTNTYKNTGLKRNTQYQYRVRAYGTVNGKNGTGAYSAVLKVKTTLF